MSKAKGLTSLFPIPKQDSSLRTVVDENAITQLISAKYCLSSAEIVENDLGCFVQIQRWNFDFDYEIGLAVCPPNPASISVPDCFNIQPSK